MPEYVVARASYYAEAEPGFELDGPAAVELWWQRCTTACAQRSHHHQSSNVQNAPTIERDAQSAAALVLAQYLNLSIGRHHESAYALLSEKDHRARAWVTYVTAEREADRLRDQVGSLGRPKFKNHLA